MSTPPKYRILIPDDRWTPFRNEIVDKALALLELNRSAVVYLALYERAWHRPKRVVCASRAQIARWTNTEERGVRGCLLELRNKGLLVRRRQGIKHSRIRTPCWYVPLADFVLGEAEWFPVPRFLVTKYCREFPNAVLLPVLVRYQHLGWLNFSWVGAPTLAERLNWSESRVRDALRTMAHKHLWSSLGTGLPRPLEILYAKTKTGEDRRRFRVRALWYRRVSKKGGGYSTVKVSEEFAKRFMVAETRSFESKS